jgi:hypothetical protein
MNSGVAASSTCGGTADEAADGSPSAIGVGAGADKDGDAAAEVGN